MNARAYAVLHPDEQQWEQTQTMRLFHTNLTTQLGGTQFGMQLWRLPPRLLAARRVHICERK